MRRRLIVLLAVAGVALGLVTEVLSAPGLGLGAADLATGWALYGAGIWGLARRPTQRRWALMVAAGAAWFAGSFSGAVGGALVYLHRGPLVHATAAAAGRRSALVVAAVAVGYADAIFVGRTANGSITALLVGALLALAAACVIGPIRARRTSRDVRAAGPLVALAGALAIAGSTEWSQVSAAYVDAALYAYEAALCLTALLLVAAASRRGRITDLVVELGPARRSPGVRQALARALGDPTLEIAYWLPDTTRWVDLDGAPMPVPKGDAGRATTLVERDRERIAAVVHDVSLLDDPQLVVAVREAATLMLSNERLHAEAWARLAEITASRQRIVAARDEQRRRLARSLHDGAEHRLADVAAAVARARNGGPAPSPTQAELLDLVERELEQARAELRELARGIHPRVLTERGLAAALASLAERSPVPVELTAPSGRLPDSVEAAAYFVCAEALTNVAKYARATRVACAVTRDGDRLVATVSDDGAGGADPRAGTGLRGLADRVETLGGRLVVRSVPGAGTTVRAELPLAPAPAIEPEAARR